MPVFCKKFKRNEQDPTEAIISSKITLPELFDQNLHAQGDVITIDLYLCKTASQKDSQNPKNNPNITFVGEATFSWKQVFEADNSNQWIDIDKPLFLTDSQGRITDANEILSAELFVKARFTDVNHPDSKLNPDGTKKVEAHPYGENLVSEEKKARREIKMGKGGKMECYPKWFKYTETLTTLKDRKMTVKFEFVDR